MRRISFCRSHVPAIILLPLFVLAAVLDTGLRAGAAAEQCRQDFIEVPVGGQACGIGVGNDRRLLVDNTPVSDVLYGWDKAPAAQQSLLIFPSPPNERFVVVVGCYVACAWPFLVDRQERTATAFEAGKYGPDKWISWSEDGRYALLISGTDDVNWVHSLDVSRRQAFALPPGNSSIIINKNTAEWVSRDTFSLDVAINNCLDVPLCDSRNATYHTVTFDVGGDQIDVTGVKDRDKGAILRAILGN